jgi:hypothetical protein
METNIRLMIAIPKVRSANCDHRPNEAVTESGRTHKDFCRPIFSRVFISHNSALYHGDSLELALRKAPAVSMQFPSPLFIEMIPENHDKTDAILFAGIEELVSEMRMKVVLPVQSHSSTFRGPTNPF